MAHTGDEARGLNAGPAGQTGHEMPEEVSVVKAIKLPQSFWRDNPARYFTVAEMTFDLHRITSDQARYRYTVIHLDADLLGIVGDIIDAPPATGKYEALKRRVIDSLSESQETKLRRLLRGQAMGDEKPSVYLQRLRNLAGGQCNDSVLRSLFMEQMPENVRGILAISPLDDLSTMAAQADRIIEVMRPQISGIQQVPSDAFASANKPTTSGGTSVVTTSEPSGNPRIAPSHPNAYTQVRTGVPQPKPEPGPHGTSQPLDHPHRGSDTQKYCYYH